MKRCVERVAKTGEELLVSFTIYKLSLCFRGSTLKEGEGVGKSRNDDIVCPLIWSEPSFLRISLQALQEA